MNIDNAAGVTEPEQTILGIDVRIYDKFVEFQNMCSTYGVRTEQGEAAYALAEKYEMDLDKAFDYVSNVPYITKEMVKEKGYEWYFGDYDEGEEPVAIDEFDPKKCYMQSVDDKDMIYCLSNCGLSYDEASVALDRLFNAYYDYVPQDCSAAFLYACAHSDSVTDYIEKATYYYLSHSKDEFDYERFDYFLAEIDCNIPIEEAFEDALFHMAAIEEEEFVNDLRSEEYANSYLLSKEEYLDAIFDEMEKRRSNW